MMQIFWNLTLSELLFYLVEFFEDCDTIIHRKQCYEPIKNG